MRARSQAVRRLAANFGLSAGVQSAERAVARGRPVEGKPSMISNASRRAALPVVDKRAGGLSTFQRDREHKRPT
jgi:hypothetical protein